MSTGAGIRHGDVVARVGISYRQLDYWCQLGYLGDDKCRGSGRARVFTEDDVAALRVIRALYELRSRTDSALRDLVPTVLERVKAGDIGRVQIAPALYLDLGEVAAGVSA